MAGEKLKTTLLYVSPAEILAVFHSLVIRQPYIILNDCLGEGIIKPRPPVWNM